MGHAFYQLAHFVINEIEKDKEAFFHGGLSERLEDSLMASLAAALDTQPRARPLTSAVPSYVQRAEKFMLDNLDKQLTLQELVDATGTSARTLHRTFRSVGATRRSACSRTCGWTRCMQSLSAATPGRGYHAYRHGLGFQSYGLVFSGLPTALRLSPIGNRAPRAMILR